MLFAVTFVPAPLRRPAPAPASRRLVAIASRRVRAAATRRLVATALRCGLVAALALVADPAVAAAAPAPTDSPTGAAPSAGPAPSAAAPAPSTSPSSTPAAPATATPSSPAPSASSPAAPEPVPADSPKLTLEGPAAPTASPTPQDQANAKADAAKADKPAAEKPPRVDGVYVGGSLGFGLGFARVNNFPTPDPFSGGLGTLRAGQVLFRWMSIGVEIAGNLGYRPADPRQRLLNGAFLVDFGFYPAKNYPLSLRAGFGAGGGAVREAGRPGRSGFGGAVFTAAARYEFFPGAARRRPHRGGGFAIGPELGWVGFMPAAKGRPMSHTVYLGLFIGFYFGS